MATARRIQLASELRTLREEAGLTRAQAALILDYTPTNITHIENGRNQIRKGDLDALCRAYGASAEKHATLEEIRMDAKKVGWWSTLGLPHWLEIYVGLEAEATKIRAVELELVHGLLQTEGYARTVHVMAEHMTSPDDIDRRVGARMRRQTRLTGPNPLELEVVMSEAALRRCGWHPSCDQLQQLLKRVQLPNVTVRLIPFSAGLHGSMQGTFSLMDFSRKLLPKVGWQENIIGGQVVDDPATMNRLEQLYEGLSSQALNPKESLELIEMLVG
jgi:transcriptional regulator with XRE-family HTH domain